MLKQVQHDERERVCVGSMTRESVCRRHNKKEGFSITFYKCLYRFKTSRCLYSFITISDVIHRNAETMIESDDIEFINYILDNYAGYSGAELESMTHKEDPWLEARDGYAPMQSCNNIISELEINYERKSSIIRVMTDKRTGTSFLQMLKITSASTSK